MENAIMKILSEQGLIYALFFLIVGGFIWKGMPYIANKFEQIVEKFLSTIKEMQISYKEELKEIRETFIIQIEKSNEYHEKHSSELKDIRDILNSKLK